jgi:hypothetical protein
VTIPDARSIDSEFGSPVDCAVRYLRKRPDELFLAEREAAADVDDFVARLRARVGPVERASAGELAAAEAGLGGPLPPLPRRLHRDARWAT